MNAAALPDIWIPDYSPIGERLRLPKWARPWERTKEDVAVEAIAIDSESTLFTEASPGNNGTRNSPTFTNLGGTIAYAIIGCGAQTSATSVTINAEPTLGGTSMTRIQVRNPVVGTVSGNGGQIGLFRLLTPGTGSLTLSYSWTGNCFETWAYVVTFTGMNTTTPEVQTVHGANDSDGGTVTANITSVVAGNFTLSAWGRGAQLGTASQTQRFKNNVGSAHAMDNGGAQSTSAASGTVTHAWTANTGSDRHGYIITELAAASASGKGIVADTRRVQRNALLRRHHEPRGDRVSVYLGARRSNWRPTRAGLLAPEYA